MRNYALFQVSKRRLFFGLNASMIYLSHNSYLLLSEGHSHSVGCNAPFTYFTSFLNVTIYIRQETNHNYQVNNMKQLFLGISRDTSWCFSKKSQ